MLCRKFVRVRGGCMRAVGDKQRGTIRPDFDKSISIDFRARKSPQHFMSLRAALNDAKDRGLSGAQPTRPFRSRYRVSSHDGDRSAIQHPQWCCVLKPQKPVLPAFLLHVRFGKSYGFYGFRGRNGSFSGKNPIPTCSLDAEHRS